MIFAMHILFWKRNFYKWAIVTKPRLDKPGPATRDFLANLLLLQIFCFPNHNLLTQCIKQQLCCKLYDSAFDHLQLVTANLPIHAKPGSPRDAKLLGAQPFKTSSKTLRFEYRILGQLILRLRFIFQIIVFYSI